VSRAITTERRAWWVLGAMCLPLLAQSLDVSGMGLLLPSIGADLGAGATALAWVMNANALAFGALLLTSGRLADRIGPRPLLLGGVGAFGVASLLCAIAPSTGWLVAARALQGVASSACFTTSLAVVDATFDERRRPGAIGLWGAVSGAGSAFGPLVAGALAGTIGWRWFFVVNAPLCLAAVPVMAWLVPRETAAAHPSERRTGGPVGLVAVAVGFVALSLAVGSSATAAARLAPVAIALACVAVLVREHRRHRPVVDPDAVGGRWSQAAMVVGFCSTWSFAATLVVGSAVLQQGRGMSPLAAGATFLAFSGAFAVAGAAVGRLVRNTGIGTALVAAMLVAAAGTAAFALTRPTGALVVVIVCLAVAGLGQGLAFDASTTASLAGVPGRATGQATGAEQTLRLLGSVLGVGASSAIIVAVRGGAASGDGARTALLVAAGVTLLGGVAARLLRPPAKAAAG
jgi:MFS family permease